ncbi:uncharacterized protein OCT59_016291 [Rhizophagus irregularis]|uniref:uncharacterized protein n=1 Tax=Rhizophagus irregularis TaxID=588596 RepID=UPI003319A69C|nr:hypothetical protein OCT59_016291 [Rhizophagus irregularis]
MSNFNMMKNTFFKSFQKNNKENRIFRLIETEEVRLARDRIRKRRKVAEESNEERKARLECDRERKRRKVAEESNEEREARLERDRERKRRKVAEETNEERETRLARDQKRKIPEETHEEYEARLEAEEEVRRARARNKYQLRKARETPKQFAARLSQNKPNIRRKRVSESSGSKSFAYS